MGVSFLKPGFDRVGLFLFWRLVTDVGCKLMKYFYINVCMVLTRVLPVDVQVFGVDVGWVKRGGREWVHGDYLWTDVAGHSVCLVASL